MNKTKKLQTRSAKKLKVETVDDAMKNFKAECKKTTNLYLHIMS